MLSHDHLLGLERYHLNQAAVDGYRLEKGEMGSVLGGGNREAVGSADLQVVLDPHARPPEAVGTYAFQFPGRDRSVIRFDVDVPPGVRVQLLELREDAGKDEFLVRVELCVCRVMGDCRRGHSEKS